MPEVADASIGIHFRGDTLPAEARAEATKAGLAAGDGFQDSFATKLRNFARSFKPSFTSSGEHAGETFSAGFVRKLNGLVERLNLRGQFGAEGRSSGLSFSDGFNAGLARMMRATRLEVESTGEGFRSLGRAISGLEIPGKKFYNRWRQAPHGLRQFAFYVALFAALGESIAILGSAAGSSLAVLGTSALAAGLGIGVLVAGFKGMNGELSSIAPLARPAAVALKEMGKSFSDMRQVIQGRLFENLADPIRELTSKLLPRLSAGFEATAITLNGFLRSFAEALTTPKSLERMTTLLDGLQPIIANLGRLTIALGGALARIFEAALPSARNFTDTLADMVERFNRFLDSEAGQEKLVQFFGTLDRVMGALGPLIGATGKMLASLVTPDSLARFERTIGILTEFQPALGGILRAIGALDPIGIVAQALGEIGRALGPVMPQLESLGGSVGDSIKNVFTVVGDILENLAGQAIPALDSFLKAIQPGLEDFLGLVSDENVTSNGEGLVNMLTDLGTAISDLIGFVVQVNDAFQPLADVLNGAADGFNNAGLALGGFLRNEEQATTQFNETVNQFFNDMLTNLNTWATGIKDGIRNAWEGGIEAVSNWANGVNETINTFISETVTNIANWGMGILNGINNFTSGSLAAFGTWASGIITGFSTWINETINMVIGWAAGIATTISGWVSGAIANFQNFATTVSGVISGWVGNVVGFFANFAGSVASTIAGWVGSAIGFFQSFAATVSGIVSGWVGNIVSFFRNFAATVAGVVSGWVNNIVSFFRNMASTAASVISGFVNNAVNFFSSLVSRAASIVSGIVGAVTGAFNNMRSAALGVISGFINSAIGFFASLPGRIAGALGGIAGAVAGAFGNLAGIASRAVESLIAPFRGVGDRIRAAIGSIGNVLGNIKLPFTASGGVFSGAQTRIIGEAGPEAVVPLRRNLSLVDPSVRALSAFAQGKSPDSFPVETMTSSKIVESGAIRIYTTNPDPYTTATAVLDRIVAKL